MNRAAGSKGSVVSAIEGGSDSVSEAFELITGLKGEPWSYSGSTLTSINHVGCEMVEFT